ncbi:hypothetical protein M378DRAFT_10740 [Amanita muscaria Koide BX008]|uniref:Uncharacterized protein n=1 Tax=Amanita muscaria (strain Koide BX008) TaxID=946122 RepID=A0A0C2WV52_AMAMK|nr:hypothetical protein M378DRAFT_10740 [Amanita muscaria Koide BX008]
MMGATIAITPYTPSTSSAPATFDAGRQPLAALQFNTPEQKRSVKVRKQFSFVLGLSTHGPTPKPKKSVEVPKQIADVFFSPQAVSPSAGITYTLNEVDVEDLDDDDDIPIAKLKEIPRHWPFLPQACSSGR